MARLVLWDVDGTLIHSDGIGAQVFDRAFEHVLGLPLPVRVSDAVRLGGKTDPEIALEYLDLMRITDAEGRLAPVLARLELELAGVAEVLANRGATMPGVPDVLTRLAAADGVHQTLLTGNLAANAAVKVGAFGLDRWLDLEIGAYGSDDPDRRKLVPLAEDRCRRLRGADVVTGDTWVVGDTERDLVCARAGGARCLLVATGHPTFDDLAALGPDAVLPDLADVDAVVDLLLS